MNKILNSKLFTSFVAIVVLGLTLSSIKLDSQRNMVDRQVKNMESKISEVQKDVDYLNKFLVYFRTPAFLEKEARLKLNYKEQGEEVVFVYKDKQNKEVIDSVGLEELLEKMPNYKKWFLYLLGY